MNLCGEVCKTLSAAKTMAAVVVTSPSLACRHDVTADEDGAICLGCRQAG